MASAPWLAVGQLQGRWTDAGELEVGDLIWQADGTTGIVESGRILSLWGGRGGWFIMLGRVDSALVHLLKIAP